jgi:hypothetical protein
LAGILSRLLKLGGVWITTLVVLNSFISWFVGTDGRLVLLDWFFLVVAVFFVSFVATSAQDGVAMIGAGVRVR